MLGYSSKYKDDFDGKMIGFDVSFIGTNGCLFGKLVSREFSRFGIRMSIEIFISEMFLITSSDPENLHF